MATLRAVANALIASHMLHRAPTRVVAFVSPEVFADDMVR